MPKAPLRTLKKKKYNSRFPPARIKKIMQTDEDVGKVAATVPIIISRALELFIESLIHETSITTMARNAKTLSTSHIKQTIHSNKQFDFLRDLVANVPDHNTEESLGNGTGNGTRSFEAAQVTQDNGDVPQKKKRGRPKKTAPIPDRKKHGESSKASSETSEDEEEDEEEDDEETESEDDDKVPKTEKMAKGDPISSASSLPYTPARSNSGPSTLNTAGTQGNPSQFPPVYPVQSVMSLPTLPTQPQQMPAHHQPPQTPQQLQLSMGGAPPSSSSMPPVPHPYLPALPLSAPSTLPLTNSVLPPGGLQSYPAPPQFPAGPYQQMPVQMMPSAHQPVLAAPSVYPVYLSAAQGMSSGALQQASSPQAQQAQQAHPINLSMSSQRGPHPPSEADDYDS